jgi:hypothetical protein
LQRKKNKSPIFENDLTTSRMPLGRVLRTLDLLTSDSISAEDKIDTQENTLDPEAKVISNEQYV